MFAPGHLHCASPSGHPAFTIDLRYEVRRDAAEGAMLHCALEGSIDGKPFAETFELHRDMAPNLASVATRKLTHYGLEDAQRYFLHDHREFELMFDDIRRLLNAHAGDRVDLEHLEKDGFGRAG